MDKITGPSEKERFFAVAKQLYETIDSHEAERLKSELARLVFEPETEYPERQDV